MACLTHDTLQKLQDCIREIYSNLEIGSFPEHTITAIAKVIPSSVASYAQISRQKSRMHYVGKASCRTWEGLDAFVRHMDEHPVLNFLHTGLLKPHPFRDDIEKSMLKRFPSLRQDQHYSAAKISDALADRRFQRLGIFNEFFRRNEVAYQLLLSFLPRGSGYSMISFNRDKLDFSEEERLLLNLIGPHIVQAYKNAESFAKARRAFTGLEQGKRSLKDYGLTAREEDVLHWVARGKTNAEVAKILRIAPGTVKIHLERTYHKLGVENRTTAALLMLENNGKR